MKKLLSLIFVLSFDICFGADDEQRYAQRLAFIRKNAAALIEQVKKAGIFLDGLSTSHDPYKRHEVEIDFLNNMFAKDPVIEISHDERIRLFFIKRSVE